MSKKNSSHKKILLVEDDFILAMDAEDTIASDGAIVKVADTVTSALKVLAQSEIDYAIVDLNLGNDNSKPVIEKLKQNEIPFVIVTGADLPEIEKLVEPDTTIFRKPVDYKWVLRKLK